MGQWIRWLLCASLVMGVALFIAFSWQWKLMVDSPIIHYANFMIREGVQPYRELRENNLPGAYMIEWFGMHAFGGGDVAWRIFEFFELAVSTACLVWIALPYDWVAGLFAGCLFTVLHGAEGPYYSGEREVALTTLVLCGYAALFLARRRNQPAWMLPMGFTLAFAAAIKPTVAPLPVLLLIAVVWLRNRQRQPWASWVAWALTGMLAAVAFNLGYLMQHQALAAFLHLQRTITTYYAQLASLTVSQMVRRLFYQPVFDVLLAGSLLLARRRNRPRWTSEQWLLLLGVGIGVLSYIVQRKNFLHHRYLYLNLAFLLIGIELMQALRSRPGWHRWMAAGLAMFVAFWVVPSSVVAIRGFHPQSDLTEEMEADLRQLQSIASLQRDVVCLDQVFGCLNALYHLRLVENVPLSGDMLLFSRSQVPVIEDARNWFWQSQQARPADIVVLTNENFQSRNDFTRTARWPQYQAFLDEHYRLLVERSFPCEFGHRDPEEAHLYRYRLYVRNGSLWSAAKLAPQPAYSCQ